MDWSPRRQPYRRGRLARWLVLCLAIASPAGAHVGIDDQIDGLTQRIAAEPRDAALHLRRGELHRLRGDWHEARADYRQARALDPGLAVVDLCLGTMWLESGHPRRALAALIGFLDERPANPEGLATRARAREALGDRLAAAADFTAAIEGIRPPRLPDPDLYLKRARTLAAAGPAHVQEALRGLDEGLKTLGGPVALQILAIDLEVGRAGFEAALVRIDRIAAQSKRREPWLVRRGAILERAGRRAEAREAYAQALAAIEALPTSRRAAAAVTRLDSEAEAGLARLQADQ